MNIISKLSFSHKFFALISVLGCYALTSYCLAQKAESKKFVIHETFESLENWLPLPFAKIERHSKYEISQNAKLSVLKATSDNAASAIVNKQKFEIAKYPILKWRWKASNILAAGDASKKSGDDYPIRLYVFFEYNPQKASFTESIQYKAAKVFYGEYPPHSSLNYIWSNRVRPSQAISSPYTERSKMIAIDSGVSKLGAWREHEVDIYQDYKDAFETEPPKIASIAVMTDSDNTHEKTEAFIDYIILRSRP